MRQHLPLNRHAEGEGGGRFSHGYGVRAVVDVLVLLYTGWVECFGTCPNSVIFDVEGGIFFSSISVLQTHVKYCAPFYCFPLYVCLQWGAGTRGILKNVTARA